MTIREIPIEALFGDVVVSQELAPYNPRKTRIAFASGRWLLCNLNTGTLKAYERHERTSESI
jgi:hypothetical protein